MKRNLLLTLVFNSFFLNAQMALDQTVNGTSQQVYKTITFANGNENNNPSYNFTGSKNIDLATSDSYGGQPLFWRNTGGNGTFLDTHIVGGSSSTTIANEVVGGNTISWNQAQSRQKTVASDINLLGINYTGAMKRARADTNADGLLDAQLTTYSLPSGTAAQTAGFQIGDIASFLTPEIVSASTGSTLLTQKESYKVLNNNWEWQDTLNGPTGWLQRNIFDWISTALSTSETNKAIKSNIYPNPAKDFITIKNEKIENFTFQMFDVSGKTILSRKSKSNEKIEIQTLENGNYILQISTESGQKENLKFIKN